MTHPEFKSFGEIKKFTRINFSITQKIHGSNATILIWPNEDKGGELDLVCGSRTRWIYPGDDNYGFAAFVHAHRDEFIKKLGVGKHDGEWAGLGINSGEGLLEKKFVLFDWWKWPAGRELPAGCLVVPVLYQGEADLRKIDEVMEDLKTNGSKLVPGFMRPEGVVINLNGTYYKKVFKAEETKWKGGDPNKPKVERIEADYSHLLQPVRLEKLLSRDSQYLENYPKSLGKIVFDYMDDLVKEGQIVGSPGEIIGIRKGASSQVFSFVKTIVEQQHGF